MKTIALVMSLVVCGALVSAASEPAFASRMNGKGSPSSDGGRSYRFKLALQRAAIPRTCSAYATSCIRDSSSSKTDAFQMCQAAKAQCLRTGVHVGPYSGRQFAGMDKR